MIVLDTNVLSELMKREADRRVVAWVDSIPPGQTAITAFTVAEILYGIRRLPEGVRRRRLLSVAGSIFETDFRDRVLVFNAAAAVEYASLVVKRDEAGRPISTVDAQIAAVCRVHECTLATRNVADFAGTGIQVVNPWTDGAPANREPPDEDSDD